MPDEAIRFQAQVFKIQTLIDGGIRLTLDLINPTGDTVLSLLDAKRPGAFLEMASVVVITVKQQETSYDIQKGRKRKSEWQTAEVQSADSNT